MRKDIKFALVVLVVLAIGATWFVSTGEEKAARKLKAQQREKETAIRVERGPYLEHDNPLTFTKDGDLFDDLRAKERIKVVVIPHKWGEFMDKRCVIYVNYELKLARMQCEWGAGGEND